MGHALPRPVSAYGTGVEAVAAAAARRFLARVGSATAARTAADLGGGNEDDAVAFVWLALDRLTVVASCVFAIASWMSMRGPLIVLVAPAGRRIDYRSSTVTAGRATTPGPGVAWFTLLCFGGTLTSGGPGSLVGMDAVMRSLHPPPAAHHRARDAAQAGRECALAEALLGASHPLVGLLRRSDAVLEQLVWVTAVQAAGLVFLSGDLKFGLALALAAVVVQLGLGCRLAALRGRRRELCLELIVAGRQALPLTCVDRQRRRLIDPGTWEGLARSIDEIVNTASRPLPRHPAARPFFYVGVIRRVAPELCQVASLLRGAAPCVRGVAAVEWLLTSPASPLYGVDAEPLRQELGRVRYLLCLTP